MGSGRRRSVSTAERLGRMLVIVPYLIRHPGTTISEAASLFDVPEGGLRQDLDLLFLSGLPPYGPGDLIDVEIDEEGAVWITMADHFARPVRLTRQEALAVRLRATELSATPGIPQAPALAAALDKLEDALGDRAPIVASPGAGAPEHLEELRMAATEQRRVRIDYVSVSSGSRSWRTIEPEVLFAAAGNWYVAAWDVESDGERLFRADRVAALEPTDERFEPRGLEGAGRALFTPTGGNLSVRLRLQPPARWVAEYYATAACIEHDDGSLEVELPTKQLGWIARLLLRLHPSAEVLEPPSLAQEVRTLARRSLERYESRPAPEPDPGTG